MTKENESNLKDEQLRVSFQPQDHQRELSRKRKIPHENDSETENSSDNKYKKLKKVNFSSKNEAEKPQGIELSSLLMFS